MTKKIAIITDSSCSPPQSVLNKYGIQRVPISIDIDGDVFKDPCNDERTLALFSSGRLNRQHEVSTSAPETDDFESAIDRAVDNGSKLVIVQTVNRTMGDSYNNANIAASNARRRINGADVTIRVMDSRTAMAGQALMAAETLRRMLAGGEPSEVRRQMDNVSENIQTFVLPKDPTLARERSSRRNEKSVGKFQALLASALGIHPIICNSNDTSFLAAKPRGFENAARELFNHACKQIERGLLSPLIAVDFAGPVEELKAMPGYAELKATAEQHKVQIMPAVMGIVGGIYVSVGSVTLALASENKEWEG